jgi:hypothetical protein
MIRLIVLAVLAYAVVYQAKRQRQRRLLQETPQAAAGSNDRVADGVAYSCALHSGKWLGYRLV